MKKFIFLALFSLYAVILVAQTRYNDGDKGFIYNKEKGGDIRLHTQNGWDVNYFFGDIKNYYTTTFYRIGIGELKHYKELSKSMDGVTLYPTSGFGSYSFGKQNYCFPVRLSYGIKHYYTEKAAINGVALGVSYSGGLTLALMKPYYLELSNAQDVQPLIIKYSPETADQFLDITRIHGKADFFKGVGETKIIPGIHLQAGLHLDWGAFDEFLKAAEAGVMLDVFVKKLPIMVNTDTTAGNSVTDINKPFFLNFYISFQFGKRE